MKKQNIEDIFSSLENFSSVPPPELWTKIEEKLDKPKKKKVTVIWWSLAASLLVGLTIPSILYFNDSTLFNNNNKLLKTNEIVVDGQDADSNKNRSGNEITHSDSQLEDSSSANAAEDTDNPLKNSIQTAGINNSDASADNSGSFHPNNPQRYNTQAKKSSARANENIINHNTGKRNTTNFSKNSNNTVLANNAIFSNRKFNGNVTPKFASSVFDDAALNQKDKATIEFKGQQIAGDSNPTDKIQNSDNPSLAQNKIGGSDILLSKQDSLQLAELQNLEKKAHNPKKRSEEENPSPIIQDKWDISVFAGLASSENTTNEKTLGSVNDSKQSASYGVKTKYKLNKKWAVGSGFKINELGQSVANVSYMKIQNEAFFTTADHYIAQNAPASPLANNNQYILLSANTKEAIRSENIQSGNLNQSLRYVEMPVEVSYSLFNKNKASIKINTGGFVGKLISNRVSLDGSSIGENANANDYVYGSTFSSTFLYRVYKKTNLFVEPAMNYYMNPLENQSFNQFQWGFNFGLNVSF